MRYDSTVIEQFASKLYSKAKSIVVIWALFGFFIGLSGAGIFAAYITQKNQEPTGFIAIGPILGLLLGYVIGAEKAFELKLKAQMALCQVQIEKNTRPI